MFRKRLHMSDFLVIVPLSEFGGRCMIAITSSSIGYLARLMNSRISSLICSVVMRIAYLFCVSAALVFTIVSWKYFPDAMGYFIPLKWQCLSLLPVVIYTAYRAWGDLAPLRIEPRMRTWQSCAEAFAHSRLLKTSFEFLLMPILIIVTCLFFVTFRLLYYVVTSTHPSTMYESFERRVFDHGFWIMLAQFLMILAIVVTHRFAFIPFHCRKWQYVLESSTNDQTSLDALDKLIRLELFCRKIESANEYSVRLLSLAEKMHSTRELSSS
jgi:hypothetical protein